MAAIELGYEIEVLFRQPLLLAASWWRVRVSNPPGTMVATNVLYTVAHRQRFRFATAPFHAPRLPPFRVARTETLNRLIGSLCLDVAPKDGLEPPTADCFFIFTPGSTFLFDFGNH